MKDAFSAYHPAVNLLFFLGAIVCGAVFQHPAYLATSVLCAFTYYLYLGKRKSLKAAAFMLLIPVWLAAVNPLFNSQGEHILFHVFGRPYTLEALLYGCATAGVLLTVLLWCGCYNRVLTGDKFASLFGNWIPSLSLLLLMVLRLVPNLIRKTGQIIGARKSIGKGGNSKLREGMTVLGTLMSWSLEGGVITADSMRSRGYGCAKRQSFLLYRMQNRDRVLLMAEILLLAAVTVGACRGQANASYTPGISFAPPSWGIILYGAFLFIPLALNIKEAIAWRISRSKI